MEGKKLSGFSIVELLITVSLLMIIMLVFSRITIIKRPQDNFLYFIQELNSITLAARQSALQENAIVKLELIPNSKGGVVASIKKYVEQEDSSAKKIKQAFIDIKNLFLPTGLTIDSSIVVKKVVSEEELEKKDELSQEEKARSKSESEKITSYFFPLLGTCDSVTLKLIKKFSASEVQYRSVKLNSVLCRFEEVETKD